MVRKGLIIDELDGTTLAEQLFEYPCVCYTRTQEQGKTRNVWGYPVSDTVYEQTFFIPTLKIERTLPFRSALIGPDAVDTAMTKLLSHNDKIVYCVDFTAYDASIRPELSALGFECVMGMFDEAVHNAIQLLYKRFCTIPIYTPDGEIRGSHGVPSGSSFTNTIDSLVQFMVADVDQYSCQIQGDDGVYCLDNQEELLDLKERFRVAGLSLNEDKSYEFESKEAVYLQRYYHPAYLSKQGGLGGVYSAMRAMNRIKYLERWSNFKKMNIDGSDFFSLRTITILENCKHHPAFEEIVKLAKDLDNKGLEYSSKGLAAYSRAQESKAKAGVYNQYGLQRGLSGFETVKVLNKL
jgi:hypothetical protein